MKILLYLYFGVLWISDALDRVIIGPRLVQDYQFWLRAGIGYKRAHRDELCTRIRVRIDEIPRDFHLSGPVNTLHRMFMQIKKEKLK